MESDLEPAVLEAVNTAGLVANFISETKPGTTATCDKIFELAARKEIPFQTAAADLGIALTPELRADVITGLIHHYNEGGAGKLLEFVDDPIDPSTLTNPTIESLYLAVAGASHTLAIFSVTSGLMNNAFAEKVAKYYLQLAKILPEFEQHELAYKCAISSANFLVDLTDERRRDALERAVTLAATLNLPRRQQAELMAFQAHTLIAASRRFPELGLVGFRALETAIRHDPGTSEYLPTYDDLVRHAIATGGKHLAPLAGLYFLSRRNAEHIIKKFAGSDDFPDAYGPDTVKILDLYWEGTADQIYSWITTAGALARDISNASVIADVRPPVSSIVVDWATMRFAIPAFQRCVPFGNSLLNETEDVRADQILLFSHELTHVCSLLGDLGANLFALRAANLLTEIVLWISELHEKSDEAEASLASNIQKFGPARLTDVTPEKCALANLSLELSLKRQALEQIWTPWLEGLAIFSEHAADPTLDESHYSPLSEVMNNIVDVQTDIDQSDPEFEAKMLAFLNERSKAIEDMTSSAIKTRSCHRMRAYLFEYRDHYLAGYLALRSIAAHWRRRLGRQITGPQLLRAFLHLTRYGMDNAIPPLSLPYDQFSEEAHAGFLDFVTRARNASAEDLATVMSLDMADGTVVPGRWIKGKLVANFSELGDVVELASSVARGLVDAALSSAPSLGGADSDKDESERLDELARKYARIVKSQLEHGEAYVFELLNKTAMTRLGETEAPFFLSRRLEETITEMDPVYLLHLFIRTRENDPNKDRPINAYQTIPLSEKHATALKAEIDRGEGYLMHVVRVADFSVDGPAEIQPWMGRNFIVLQFGSWSYVQPMGLWMGHFANDAITEYVTRMCENSELHHAEIERMKGGIQSAVRTKNWLENLDEDQFSDFDEATHRILKVALSRMRMKVSELFRDDKQRSHLMRAADDLCELIFGTELGKSLSARGLEVFVGKSPFDRRELIQVLDETGRKPAESTWLEGLDDGDQHPARQLFASTSFGWDVCEPIGFERLN